MHTALPALLPKCGDTRRYIPPHRRVNLGASSTVVDAAEEPTSHLPSAQLASRNWRKSKFDPLQELFVPPRALKRQKPSIDLPSEYPNAIFHADPVNGIPVSHKAGMFPNNEDHPQARSVTCPPLHTSDDAKGLHVRTRGFEVEQSLRPEEINLSRTLAQHDLKDCHTNKALFGYESNTQTKKEAEKAVEKAAKREARREAKRAAKKEAKEAKEAAKKVAEKGREKEAQEEAMIKAKKDAEKQPVPQIEQDKEVNITEADHRILPKKTRAYFRAEIAKLDSKWKRITKQHITEAKFKEDQIKILEDLVKTQQDHICELDKAFSMLRKQLMLVVSQPEACDEAFEAVFKNNLAIQTRKLQNVMKSWSISDSKRKERFERSMPAAERGKSERWNGIKLSELKLAEMLAR